MKSASIKTQLDYFYSIDMINDMLSKEALIGSHKVGTKYALFYKEQIEKMLRGETIDKLVLSSLEVKVKEDLTFIKKDKEERISELDERIMKLYTENHPIYFLMSFMSFLKHERPSTRCSHATFTHAYARIHVYMHA